MGEGGRERGAVVMAGSLASTLGRGWSHSPNSKDTREIFGVEGVAASSKM